MLSLFGKKQKKEKEENEALGEKNDNFNDLNEKMEIVLFSPNRRTKAEAKISLLENSDFILIDYANYLKKQGHIYRLRLLLTMLSSENEQIKEYITGIMPSDAKKYTDNKKLFNGNSPKDTYGEPVPQTGRRNAM